MTATVRWYAAAALAGLVTIGANASPVQAQFSIMPGLPAVNPRPGMAPPMMGPPIGAQLNPVPSNPYLGGGVIATNPIINNPVMTNPYWDPFLFAFNPFGGYLRGVADVTNANANYQVTIQNARLVREQVVSAQIENRRRLVEEIRWERMNTPTMEDLRIRDMESRLNRSRRNPPLTEIWSGDALNSLFDHLAKEQGKGNRGPRVDLEEETLKHINFATGAGGNVALLKTNGDLKWPLPLAQNEAFTETRTKLTDLIKVAVNDLKAGQLPKTATLGDMKIHLDSLQARLNEMAANGMAPTEYIESKRYLNMLEDSYKALRDPNVANLLNQKGISQSKTVAELVKNMVDQGVKFAPAGPGDEQFYRALHWLMVSYDDSLTQLNSTNPPRP